MDAETIGPGGGLALDLEALGAKAGGDVGVELAAGLERLLRVERVATGGVASLFHGATLSIDPFDPDLPIRGLSHGFDHLYDAYEHIVSGFSDDEKDRMFRGTAAAWFRIPQRRPDGQMNAAG